jgi:hypothetical protein
MSISLNLKQESFIERGRGEGQFSSFSQRRHLSRHSRISHGSLLAAKKQSCHMSLLPTVSLTIATNVNDTIRNFSFHHRYVKEVDCSRYISL